MKPQTPEAAVHLPVNECLFEQGLDYTPDGRFVCWGRGNKRHPRNWRSVRKIYDTTLILFLDFFVYVDPVETTAVRYTDIV